MSFFVIFCISLFHLLQIPDARSEETGLKFGGFQWNGAVELGYRFTDIDGSRDRYKETVNLMEGMRLLDFSLIGKNLAPGAGPVDLFSLTGRNIGDPFPAARLEVKKNKTYDLVTSFNQYKYFSKREDDSFLTDNIDFHSKFTNFITTLSVFPKDDIKLNFGYRHWERDGNAAAPRLTYPTALPEELDEGLNEYFVSGDFRLGEWDFHIKETFWNFRNKDKIDVPGFYEKQDANMNTFVNTIKAHRQFGERLDFDGAFVYAHANGWSRLNTAPEIGVSSGKSDVENDTYIVELGLSYKLVKNMILHADYRFHNFDQDGKQNTDPFTLDPFLSNNGQANPRTNYSVAAHTGTFQLEYLPLDNLVLRAGYQFQYRDIEGESYGYFPQFVGGKDPASTTQWTHGWVGSIDWKPYKFLSVFGEYKGSTVDNPYTWISPDSTNIAKVKIKYDTPLDKLSLKGIVSWRRRENPQHDSRVDAQDYTISASYVPSFLPKLSVDASFTYENIHDRVNIFDYAPYAYQAVSFNSSAYIYGGGMTYEGIYKGLGARVYGSYAQTLKENPQRYLDGTFSVFYKNKWLIPTITYEKTYLHDHVNRADSFDAHLIMFSLRKEF